VVPPDHLVRKIDAVLELGWLHRELAPYYSHTGRPSIDPELLIRMLIVGYVFGIRSERNLCAEVQVNFAYRWFCGLGIEDRLPNHSVCRIFKLEAWFKRPVRVPAATCRYIDATDLKPKRQSRSAKMVQVIQPRVV
jgi:transposase